MPRLSREERLIALGMIQANMNYSQVAAILVAVERLLGT